MNRKSFWRTIRMTMIPMLAIVPAVLAQTATSTQFSGVIEDYTPATNSPMGPWEMRGPWTLTLQASGKATFTATLTMELSDYTRNPSNIDSTSGATSRMQHTHHIAMQDATVTQNTTGGGFEVSGPATVTKDGSPAPFAASTLTVDIIGGTSVEFSNITLQFEGGATGHFGTQLIHGVVANPITATPGGTPGGTNAVVTPLSLTTSQSSVVLDASGSTSASGNLEYLFEVVAGGKQPALLQSPTNPKATVDFVNGPGLYLVQVVVTDAHGGTSTSPVIMLTYQP